MCLIDHCVSLDKQEENNNTLTSRTDSSLGGSKKSFSKLQPGIDFQAIDLIFSTEDLKLFWKSWIEGLLIAITPTSETQPRQWLHNHHRQDLDKTRHLLGAAGKMYDRHVRREIGEVLIKFVLPAAHASKIMHANEAYFTRYFVRTGKLNNLCDIIVQPPCAATNIENATQVFSFAWDILFHCLFIILYPPYLFFFVCCWKVQYVLDSVYAAVRAVICFCLSLRVEIPLKLRLSFCEQECELTTFCNKLLVSHLETSEFIGTASHLLHVWFPQWVWPYKIWKHRLA